MSARCETDWFRVICDLKKNGFTLQKIANVIEVPKPTIVGWKQGAEPKHGDGERLVKLWCKSLGRTREELPFNNLGSYHFKISAGRVTA